MIADVVAARDQKSRDDADKAHKVIMDSIKAVN